MCFLFRQQYYVDKDSARVYTNYMLVSKTIEKRLQDLPDTPGIYLYYNQEKELIYVGKATSLRSRVRSYFRGQRTPRPIEEMLHEVVTIDWRETNSVLEAVIVESLYIKKFLPRYNVLGKDDKSWNYIVISKDAYPQVQTIREREYQMIRNKEQRAKDFGTVFGPYPGLNTKATMKLLRRLFRFSTCEPGQKRPCLYYQMGQCLGVCVGTITPTEYKARVIRPLTLFLSGKTSVVIRLFKKEMIAASANQHFEEAARLRDQLEQLTRIQDMTIINKSFFEDPTIELKKLVNRIEGYDISNTGATEKVASMVVFENGEANRSQYRKFIIKTVPGQSDVDSLAEVLNRRLNHLEWPLPQLLLIDGGRPQVRTINRVLQARGIVLPVVGIAKGPERKRNDIILGANSKPLVLWLQSHQKLLAQVRDEAHRFAITFHRTRRGKRFLKKEKS